MAVWTASSGDLVVDRRLAFAEGYAAEGDLAAAIGILAEAMDLVPGWAAGWFRLGEWRAEAGDRAGAIAAWDR
ncbi:MAG: methyltransferase type 12, partial [Rhodobacteraceae bacterium]|nr:methyltransferase type 12 [Paracoccaceae bacterium]